MFDSTLNNKVKNFVEKVQLNNDVLKFADGLDTVVDLDNDNLSGGQNKRLFWQELKFTRVNLF